MQYSIWKCPKQQTNPGLHRAAAVPIDEQVDFLLKLVGQHIRCKHPQAGILVEEGAPHNITHVGITDGIVFSEREHSCTN